MDAAAWLLVDASDAADGRGAASGFLAAARAGVCFSRIAGMLRWTGSGVQGGGVRRCCSVRQALGGGVCGCCGSVVVVGKVVSGGYNWGDTLDVVGGVG